METTDNAAILLIEDNEDDAFFMARAVEDAGLSVPFKIARDGQAAIDYLAGQGVFADRKEYPLPGVIFLDLKLPFVPGLDVLQWIRRQPELVKVVVIVLTVSHEPVDLNRAYQLGANSIMVKPPSARQMLELARAFKLWGYRREMSGDKSG